MAAEYPDLTACLVLIDPPWLESNESTNLMPAQIEKTRLKIRHPMTLPFKKLILLGKKEHPSWTEEEIQTWALGKKLVNPHTLQSIDLLDLDWQSPVSLIGVPTLLITGDINLGGLVSPEAASLFDSLCPAGQVVRISNAGHSIQMDQFHQFSN
jgi:pimeloyl-ACP methyl ester carboxylesterase